MMVLQPEVEGRLVEEVEVGLITSILPIMEEVGLMEEGGMDQ